MADPEHVELVRQGREALREWREDHPEMRLDLQEAPLRGFHLFKADLHEAILLKADLCGANLAGANLCKALLVMANLAGANLVQANLTGAQLLEADLREAQLREANLAGADLLRVRGAEQVYGLETVRFTSAEGTQRSGFGNDASNFETCRRPWPERWLDWERLRVVGRLPLFGVSYTALILIPIVFYGLALYNDKIDLVRTWAEQIVILPDHPLQRLAPSVLERLHPRPIPSQSFLLLLSTGLLAVGSTLYTFFSPSRIKEFSRDQWCDQIGRSLLHYWPLAWKYRYIRLICAACYALGGAGAFWVLAWKVGSTALFILEHSTFPWPWR